MGRDDFVEFAKSQNISPSVVRYGIDQVRAVEAEFEALATFHGSIAEGQRAGAGHPSPSTSAWR